MPIHNADIAAILEEIADRLEIQGANPFRIRAYRNAARVVGEYGRSLRALIERGEDLTRLPGIGEDLAGRIREIAASGRCALLERLRRELPAGITDLLHVPGLGPKRVRLLYHDLDVQTLEQLYKAARDGRIRTLPGFGEKTELNILRAVEAHLGSTHRFKLATAAQYAESLVEHLEHARGVKRVEVAGSFRRMRETVGDLDILVTAGAGSDAMERFTGYDEIERVISAGSTRSSVVLRCGLQVDLRVVAEDAYGAALVYFTGSKAHNIALRSLAVAKGLKVNEYGVFEGARRIAGATEESVYAAAGLAWIPPELREDRGEIEAARAGTLPHLVELADLRGDLHAHSRASDGHDSLREMAAAAKARGFEYLAITEHSRRLAMAHGLDARRLAQQCEEIEALNAELQGITLLKGIEVDILEDGSLDLPDSALERLDLVVGAVHSRFDLTRAKQTARILRAMEHPRFDILAHPTGRLLDTREPYDVDMNAIIRQAARRGCALELNAHPERLDLLDSYCRMAKDEGVMVAIDSDAHSVADFDNLRFGIGQARRGWLSGADVLNTRSLAQLRKLLGRSGR
ncbi:MAG TPA: DNA polymerase/3'-5' exonuclease PolX [Rhodocyclaceae bacterium]|nr:MAG: DNA polymerase III [Betaproteobacteria bacterium CG2_30_68_42]PIV75377.1 MAG: DNA polymerase III [Rhodocyclales bacterium CG17_big_fil_post_rev_8_21_14_2_50_68_7]PJA58792.1 MAG: DNA polymerase III [Rhodocyclales bacterium CG_4_9_14_3_um_filter_68_10]HCX34478.1 DNA polymerase/3'-5' exonuclease PolX [Rhodocyclaceae bacterium]